VVLKKAGKEFCLISKKLGGDPAYVKREGNQAEREAERGSAQAFFLSLSWKAYRDAYHEL
jgi:hypothetical protein